MTFSSLFLIACKAGNKLLKILYVLLYSKIENKTKRGIKCKLNINKRIIRKQMQLLHTVSKFLSEILKK